MFNFNFFASFIVISFHVYIASCEVDDDYNQNLLPFVKRKIDRIENGNGLESRLFGNFNKSCVLTLLDLTDTDTSEDFSNSTLDYLNLRNEAINKVFEFCTDERKYILSQEQFLKNLKNHKSENYSEKIECFQLELANFEPNSRLLRNANLIFNKSICDEILEDFELKLMKGFKDYKNKIKKDFNLTFCELMYYLDGLMVIGRKIALRYVVMANGDYPTTDLIEMRNIFTEDSEEIVKDLIECYVLEMKNGNFGVSLNTECTILE